MNHAQRHDNDGRASSTLRNSVPPGTSVAIVQKADQRTGELTRGVVHSILTNSSDHPRGIKVRLTSGEVGRVRHILSDGVPHPTGHIGDDGNDATEARRGTPYWHSPRRDEAHRKFESRGRRRGRRGREGGSPVGAEGGPPSSGGRSSLADWFPAAEDAGVGSTPRSSIAIDVTGPSNTAEAVVTPWPCEACTYVNANLELECEMCLTERGGGRSR